MFLARLNVSRTFPRKAHNYWSEGPSLLICVTWEIAGSCDTINASNNYFSELIFISFFYHFKNYFKRGKFQTKLMHELNNMFRTYHFWMCFFNFVMCFYIFNTKLLCVVESDIFVLSRSRHTWLTLQSARTRVYMSSERHLLFCCSRSLMHYLITLDSNTTTPE